MTTLYYGDWHGKLNVIGSAIMSAERKVLDGHEPITIVQVGDFGWGFPRFDLEKFLKKRAKNGWTVPIYTCLGNHDNWVRYDKKCKEDPESPIFEIIPGSGAFVVKRGAVIQIDGAWHAFFGGADSTDRHLRTEGIDWWVREQPSMAEFELLHDNINKYKVKVVVAHEAPLRMAHSRVRRKESITACNLEKLYSLSDHQPSYHMYGHHHTCIKKKVGMTKFVCCGLHGDYFSRPGGFPKKIKRM